jgi:hypothetical protein
MLRGARVGRAARAGARDGGTPSMPVVPCATVLVL